MNAGIYAIFNCANGKLYIGQSRSLSSRWRVHLHALRHNSHSNPHLQAAFNFHGESAFIFLTLEPCPIHLLNEREAFHVSRFRSANPTFGYNIHAGGDQPIAISPATRRAMQRAQSRRRNRFTVDTKDIPDHPEKYSI